MIAPEQNSSRFENLILGNHEYVPLLNGSTARYIHFDNSASTPAFKAVAHEVKKILPWYANIYRGSGIKSLICKDIYEKSRETIARFLHFRLDEYHILFTQNATSALQLLSTKLNISKNDIVLVTKMEHQANDFPWRTKGTVVYSGIDEHGRLDLQELESRLVANNGKVALVAVTAASNVTGYINDIHAVAEVAHRYGAQIVVDGAQFVPHRSTELTDESTARSIDYFAFTAQKMYAPFGVGVLVARKNKSFNLNSGGDSQQKETDSGTPNIIGVLALATAMEELEKIGFKALTAHEKSLTTYALRELKKIPGIVCYGSIDESNQDDRLGVISFNIENMSHNLAGAILSHEGGIGVRTGSFCNTRYMNCLQSLKISSTNSSVRNTLQPIPGAIRISFGLYNSFEEIDRLMNMLQQISTEDYEGKYVVDTETSIFVPSHSEFNSSTFWATKIKNN